MRDVKSRDSSIIIDNSRNYIYNNSSTHYAHAQTEVKKKETTIKEILKKSAIQCLSSIIATLVSGVIAFFTKKGGYTYNDTPMIIICVLLAIALISSVIMAIGFLSDLFKCFSLKKVGNLSKCAQDQVCSTPLSILCNHFSPKVIQHLQNTLWEKCIKILTEKFMKLYQNLAPFARLSPLEPCT